MTWWLWVRFPVEATFLSGVFSPLTSAEACEKSSWWLWKEKLCLYRCEKARETRKHICVTDRHDMTLAVEVVLNPNTTNQPTYLLQTCAYKKKMWRRENCGQKKKRSVKSKDRDVVNCPCFMWRRGRLVVFSLDNQGVQRNTSEIFTRQFVQWIKKRNCSVNCEINR